MFGRTWRWVSRVALRREAEMWRGRCERKNAEVHEGHVRIKEVRKELTAVVHEQRSRADRAEARLAQAQTRLKLAGEPASMDGCSKVRLHRRGEAESWALEVAFQTKQKPGCLVPYRCKICPRSPVTMDRYWHVGHSMDDAGQTEKAESRSRHLAAHGRARAAGLTIGQRVDPAALANLLKTMGKS